jgi:ketosteroid isomerase-like protein
MKNGFATGRISRLVGLVAVVLATLSFAARAFAADAKAEVTDLEHKCAAATNIDELMACYDNSDALVVYDIGTPREFDGPKAVRGDFQNFLANEKNPIIEFVSLNVVTDGKMALANSVQHYTATDKSGKPVDMTFRVTDVWRREGGKWKIIHTHVSFPIDLASGKADMQSKP